MAEDTIRLQLQVQNLLQQEVWDSAELLGNFLICKSKAMAADLPAAGLGSHAESLELYADALYGKGEYRRAVAYYKQAQQHRRLGSGARLRTSAPSSSSSGDTTAAEAELKLKEGKCHAKLGDTSNALRCLVAIPPKSRSLKTQLLLGWLYKGSGLKRDAINAYKAALKLNPLALEAVMALAQLGGKDVSHAELWSIVTKTAPASSSSLPLSSFNASAPPGPSSSSSMASAGALAGGLVTPTSGQPPAFSSPSDPSFSSSMPATPSMSLPSPALAHRPPPALSAKDLSWLDTFIMAHTALHGQRPLEAIQKFSELEKQFRSSLHCLLHKAKLQIDADQLVEAHATFAKARELDSESVDLMDYYAVLLRQKSAGPLLNSLAHKLMSVDQKRPEPWVAVALYSDLKGDRDKAMALVDRALQLDRQHVLAYHVKGTLLLSMGRVDSAIAAFLEASELQKDVHSFKGLVDAYLAAHKYKEALSMAKEAVQAIPKNAKTITLIGRVLAHLPDGADKAKRAFQRALAIDRLHVDAVLALADLYMSSGEYDRCIELLRQSMEHHNYDFLHTKLGDAYTLTEEYSEALAAYHHAISINPNSAAAATGLERLEKLMRGADPDLEEDENDMNADTEAY